VDRRLSLLVKFAALDKLTGPMRAMGAGVRKTGADIGDTRRELAMLQRTSGNLKGFRDLEARLKATSDKLAEVRERQERLRKASESTEGVTKKLGRAMAAADKTAGELQREYDEQGRALQALSRKLESAGVDVADLGRHELQLDKRIGDTTAALKAQRDELARTARTQQNLSSMQQTGSSMTTTGLGLLGTGFAIGAPLKDATEEAGKYRSTMTDIALKTGLTEQATDKLGKTIAKIGPRVAQLPSDLRQGLDTLAGLGLDPQAGVKMLEPIGKAASAYKAEIDDLANATFSGIDNLKVPIGQTAKMLDVMASAGKAGAFELKDMAKYFPSLTASAAGLGQKGVGAVADLAAALQIARKGAGDAATAANNVQNLLNKINATDTITNFKKLGIDLPKAMQKAYKDGKTPIEAIAELTKKATGGDMAKLSQLFGDAQVQAALRPLIANLDQYKQIRASAEAAVGTVGTDFERRGRSGELVGQQWAATFETLKVVAGTILLPTLNVLLQKLLVITEEMSAWIDKNPEAASTILHIVAGVAALSFGLGALYTVFGPIISALASFGKALTWLRPFLPVIGRVFSFFGRQLWWLATKIFPIFRFAIMFLARGMMQAGMMMMANPIILIIVAIIAVIALAAYLIYTYWDEIKAAFWMAVAAIGAAWEAIKAFFNAGLQTLSNWWNTIKQLFFAGLAWLGALPGKLFGIGENIIMGLVDGFMSKVTWLRDKVLGVAKDIAGWFSSALGIKSPSRVFMALGGYVGDGLAIGLDKGAAAPVQRITRIAGDMKAAFAAGAMAMPAAAGAATGGAGAAGGARGGMIHVGQVVIQIQQQPGQDANALALAVRQQFEKLMRDQQAAAGSSYEDD